MEVREELPIHNKPLIVGETYLSICLIAHRRDTAAGANLDAC